MTGDLHTQLKSLYEARRTDRTTGLKVNLYTGLDVRALDAAVGALLSGTVTLECVMVGDSILSTHHGRADTRLRDAADRQWALDILIDALNEVSCALADSSHLSDLFLMGDLTAPPDGSDVTASAESFLDHGADAVKIEVDGPMAQRSMQALADRGIPVFAHLGFTPQTASLKRHGRTAEERDLLFAAARRARDGGACGLILEMVDPTANALLAAYSPHGIPCYSIFSGPRVVGGGLSVNAWDAVFRHPSGGSGFPPSAFLDPDRHPIDYTAENVQRGLTDLLYLVDQGRFPANGTVVHKRELVEDRWHP